jgi:thermitase
MQSSKSFLKLFLTLLIVAAVLLVIFLLFKSESVRLGGDSLPASVGKIISASPDHILVKFKSSASTVRQNEIHAKYNFKENSELKNLGVKIVSIPLGLTPEEAVENLKKNELDAIDFAEPDYVVELSLTPDDPWFLNWQKDKLQINAPLAWDSTVGGEDMTIAIVDTGVNCNHEDLASRCTSGWNFYDNNANTEDIHGHGTKVAGVALASGQNGIGVAGINWKSKILPLRATASNGTATYSTIANAITYAADNGAKVVNTSFQIGGSFTVDRAASYLKGKGGILVASEGNYGSDTGNKNSPNIISVSAVDSGNNLYSWSSYGSDVDVAAPGCTGATTNSNGGYGSFCGTSNAAPEVAGIISLIWAINPSLSPDQIADVLFKSSLDLGAAGYDRSYGFGVVDAQMALIFAKEYKGSVEDITTPTSPRSKCKGKGC